MTQWTKDEQVSNVKTRLIPHGKTLKRTIKCPGKYCRINNKGSLRTLKSSLRSAKNARRTKREKTKNKNIRLCTIPDKCQEHEGYSLCEIDVKNGRCKKYDKNVPREKCINKNYDGIIIGDVCYSKKSDLQSIVQNFMGNHFEFKAPEKKRMIPKFTRKRRENTNEKRENKDVQANNDEI